MSEAKRQKDFSAVIGHGFGSRSHTIVHSATSVLELK